MRYFVDFLIGVGAGYMLVTLFLVIVLSTVWLYGRLRYLLPDDQNGHFHYLLPDDQNGRQAAMARHPSSQSLATKTAE